MKYVLAILIVLVAAAGCYDYLLHHKASAAMQADEAALLARLDAAQKDNARLVAENEAASKRLDDLRSQLEQLKAQIQSATADIAALGTKAPQAPRPAATTPTPTAPVVAPAAKEAPPPPLVFPMKAGDWDTYSDTWGATDALNRTLPGHDKVGDPKEDKFIAMFCFMSNDDPGRPIQDHAKMLAENPHPDFEGVGWWGEPWLGYYISSDPAVIRKHVQMLADAGVDVMVMDNTNGVTYPKVRQAMCEVMTEMRANGMKTPQLAFFSGNGSWRELEENFYGKNLYPDLWFKWEGKPLMLIHDEHIPPDIAANFTIRDSWAWTGGGGWFGDGHDKWPWLDNFPQRAGWHDNPDRPEETSACVAQHATTSIGRSSLAQQEPPESEWKPELGLCFAQQFQQALTIKPEVIFVTGWDEWTAMAFPATKSGTFAGHPMKPGDKFFVDEYSPEFSRDIEPSVPLGDNYLYQFVGYARQFKGVRPVPVVEPQPINLDAGFAAWQQVQPEFRDTIGDPVHRDSPGWGDKNYVNNTGRNDLVTAKVSYDAHNIYFYMRTKDPITPHTDPNWMLLFIDTDNDPKTGWLGYDFVVNRADVKDDTTTVQKNVDGAYKWETVARVKYRVEKDQIEIAIPLDVLGIGILPDQINFKWADNIQQTGDVSDFTLNGDAAPNDRYYFQARFSDH